MKARRIGAILAVVAVLSFGVGVLVASAGNGKTWSDPDEAFKTDAERVAAQKASSDAFWATYANWLEKQIAFNRDASSYPVADALATTADPLPTLGEAIRKADKIVTGTVESVVFRPTADCVVTVLTTGTLKGVSSDRVSVVLPNGLMPDTTWAPQIVQVDAMPMLFPGDQVTLFMTADPIQPQLFNVQPWTGTYWTTKGGLRSVVGNPFARQMETVNPTELAAAVNLVGD